MLLIYLLVEAQRPGVDAVETAVVLDLEHDLLLLGEFGDKNFFV